MLKSINGFAQNYSLCRCHFISSIQNCIQLFSCFRHICWCFSSSKDILDKHITAFSITEFSKVSLYPVCSLPEQIGHYNVSHNLHQAVSAVWVILGTLPISSGGSLSSMSVKHLMRDQGSNIFSFSFFFSRPYDSVFNHDSCYCFTSNCVLYKVTVHT